MPESTNTCEGCGACCLHVAVPPFLPGETDGLPEELLGKLDRWSETHRIQFDVNKVESIPCAALDLETRRCTIHAHRPEVCREYAVGDIDCNLVRQRAGFPLIQIKIPF